MKIFSHGVLGMNARNLLYIHEKNPSESLSLADSKLRTKNFLSGRGIPFAETYIVITSQQELNNFSLDSLPNAFVIKPNHGSKGQGILVVKRKKNGKYLVAGVEWSADEIRLHMTDILRGTFSLYGSHDRIVIEELLLPGKEFSRYCRYGLADIRMIVYNYVPITAMVRMPTALSGGKANLAQGAIGLGLNVADGEVMSLYANRKNYHRAFPEEYQFLQGTFVSFWDSILLYSAQIQMHTGLGYLALDWVITPNGPKLLEINARAGLEIQNVNLVPLEKRLEQVSSLKVETPEKGVAIAKALFSHTQNINIVGRTVLRFEQEVNILGYGAVTLRVDPNRPHTGASEDIMKRPREAHFCVIRPGVHIPFHATDTIRGQKNLIILGQNDLKDILLDPSPLVTSTKEQSTSRFGQEVETLDAEIQAISKKVNLSSLLRPQNYEQELDMFVKNPFQYNPIFSYRFSAVGKFDEYEQELARLIQKNADLAGWQPVFARLFEGRLQEMQDRLGLLRAYQNEDAEKIMMYNEHLFGVFDPRLLSIATKKVLEQTAMPAGKQEKLLGKALSLDEVMEKVEAYLKEHSIENVPIEISHTTFSRMAVAYKKDAVKINIAARAVIREKEIDAILAHELGTHLQRFLAGQKTGLNIFRYGTGYYLSDEEGLAIYNSLRLLPEGYEKNAMYIKYYLLSQADERNFAQTATLIQSLYPQYSIETVFAQTVRLKRGIIHTERDGGGTTYQKDKIYLDGYSRVSEWIEEWWDPSLLYFGKVKISDLPLISKL